MRFGFFAFLAFFLLDLRLLEDRRRLALRFVDRDLERFRERRRGLRGFDAVLLRDLLRERLFLGPLGVAERRVRRFFEEDRRRLALRDRLVLALLLLDRLVERLAALGLDAVRRFLDEERRRLLADRVRLRLVDALRLGALGATARRRLRAFRALRRDALLDRFGARGFDAVLRRDFDLERLFFGPLGVADRRARRFLEEDRRRLALRERDLLELLDRLAARGLDAVRRLALRRRLVLRLLDRFGAFALFADLPAESLRSRLPVSLARASFWVASYASFSAWYFLYLLVVLYFSSSFS